MQRHLWLPSSSPRGATPDRSRWRSGASVKGPQLSRMSASSVSRMSTEYCVSRRMKYRQKCTRRKCCEKFSQPYTWRDSIEPKLPLNVMTLRRKKERKLNLYLVRKLRFEGVRYIRKKYFYKLRFEANCPTSTFPHNGSNPVPGHVITGDYLSPLMRNGLTRAAGVIPQVGERKTTVRSASIARPPDISLAFPQTL